jgi:DNA polymerase (family X)
LRDGSLDLPGEVLGELDWLIASVHSHFQLDAVEQTQRMIRALEHPAVSALGHPTTRLINERSPLKFDLEAVLNCAAEQRVAVELDAQPIRLDLPDVHLRRARELGVKVVITSDAHTPEGRRVMRYGVDRARRAGLQRGDVLNPRPLARLLSAIKRPRPAPGHPNAHAHNATE